MSNNNLVKKIGGKKTIFTIVILFLIWLAFFMNGYFSPVLERDALYTRGVIIGVMTGSKGTRRLHVSYYFHKTFYEESYTLEYCNECKNKCCDPGDSIIVRFNKNNPERSDVIHSLPPNTILQR